MGGGWRDRFKISVRKPTTSLTVSQLLTASAFAGSNLHYEMGRDSEWDLVPSADEGEAARCRSRGFGLIVTSLPKLSYLEKAKERSRQRTLTILLRPANYGGRLVPLVEFSIYFPLHRKDFLRLQDDTKALRALGDNDTRWNSTYKVPQRVSKLRRALALFYLQYVTEKKLPSSVRAIDMAWTPVSDICDILEKFHCHAVNLQSQTRHRYHYSL